MESNKQFIYIIFLFFGIIGMVLVFSEFIPIGQKSVEGKLMTEACKDIIAHETLRAESDFDEITNAIYSHVHSYRDESDTVLARAVIELRDLRVEAEFRNENIPMYHQKFSDVLNRLSYLELEDAIYFAEHEQVDKASGAIHRAQHYLHDAKSLSRNPFLQDQVDLMHNIGHLDDQKPTSENIQKGLTEIKRKLK